jgi:3-oxoadipate enol-lactonase
MNKVMVNGVKVNYRLEGPDTGQVVMLSHSLASCLSAWDSQVAALSDAGFRVLAYDSRGHGGSDVPPGPYTMNMLAADTLALLDFLGIEKVHFCGLSMGGMVGQILGARNPERLFSLVLSSTSPYMPPAHLWDERIKEVRNKGMKSVADATIDRWFTGRGRKRMPERVKEIKDMIMKTSPEGFCACCEAIRDMDLREVLPSISVPTLVIVGSLDQGTPVSSAEYMCSRIGSAQLKIIADAAHFVNVEHP